MSATRYRVFLGAPPAKDASHVQPRNWIIYSTIPKLTENAPENSVEHASVSHHYEEHRDVSERSKMVPSEHLPNAASSASDVNLTGISVESHFSDASSLKDPTFSNIGLSSLAGENDSQAVLFSALDQSARQIATRSSSDTLGSMPAATPIYPPDTLEAISARISLVYRNTIFHEDEEENESAGASQGEAEASAEHTTYISWPPTIAASASVSRRASRSRIRVSVSQDDTQHDDETQESSAAYSDSSSIAHFPAFRFSLHALGSLGALQGAPAPAARGNFFGGVQGAKKSHDKAGGEQRRVTLLLAVLETDGPDTIRVKRGVDAGKEVSVLRMVLGDEAGRVCKLTAWREVADAWANAGVRRGDVVLLENVNAACEVGTSPSLTASPFLQSRLEICYRTMPTEKADQRLRPDLRLGGIDPAVRCVGAVVQCFEKMAGIT